MSGADHSIRDALQRATSKVQFGDAIRSLQASVERMTAVANSPLVIPEVPTFTPLIDDGEMMEGDEEAILALMNWDFKK